MAKPNLLDHHDQLGIRFSVQTSFIVSISRIYIDKLSTY